MPTSRILVRLVGGFEVRDSLGRDRTPRGAKARGVLALLCLTPERRRPRRWIEDKLWSDRATEQASSSLRQALTQIRRALSPDADLLLADRGSVALADQVVVDLENEPGEVARKLQQGRQLLEGFDIRDPEFEDWLRAERSRLEPAEEPQTADVPGLASAADHCGRISVPEGSEDGVQRFLAQALADQIAGLVSELAVVEVYSPSLADVLVGPMERGLRLRVHTIADGCLAQVLVRLEATLTRQLLWSRRIALTDFGLHDVGSDAFYELAFDAAEAMVAAMPRTLDGDRTRAHALAFGAMREMSTFDPARLEQADRLLAAAQDVAPAAVYDAWRALLKTIMAVERTEEAPDALRAHANELARRALEQGLSNATVLGLVSQVRLLLDQDFGVGMALASQARSLNAGNAFAEIALATSQMRAGRTQEGLQIALRATGIARNSIMRHWWEMFCCLAQIATGQYREAISSAEAAHARAPHFKPPLRHLYALYLHLGDVDNARRVAERLKVLEPDFSLRRIREDPDYPAAVIRNTPLLKLHDLAS